MSRSPDDSTRARAGRRGRPLNALNAPQGTKPDELANVVHVGVIAGEGWYQFGIDALAIVASRLFAFADHEISASTGGCRPRATGS